MIQTARDVLIAPSDAARAYLTQRADLGAPINYDDLGRAALIATFRKLAEDGPTEAMLDADRRGLHTRSELEVICVLISRALLRELEEMTL